MDIILMCLGAVLFSVGIWVLAIAWVAKLSGWGRLVKQYGKGFPTSGKTAKNSRLLRAFSMRQGRGLPANYTLCIRAQIKGDRVHLRPLWVFKIRHAALAIPLADITINDVVPLGGLTRTLSLRTFPKVTIWIAETDADWLQSFIEKAG